MGTNELFGSTQWRKSSYSGGGGSGSGNCVEVAFGDGVVAARDSKAPGEGLVVASAAQWRVFLDSVIAGRFER